MEAHAGMLAPKKARSSEADAWCQRGAGGAAERVRWNVEAEALADGPKRGNKDRAAPAIAPCISV